MFDDLGRQLGLGHGGGNIPKGGEGPGAGLHKLQVLVPPPVEASGAAPRGRPEASREVLRKGGGLPVDRHRGGHRGGLDEREEGGRRGQGDLNLLRHCAGEFDARVQIFEQIVGGAAPISSSRIRRLIAGGDARGSTRLLGRPFCLRGEIVRGDAIGGKIGFPTANLEAPQQVRPGAGVYATRLEVGEQLLDAVTNVGTRPTMAGDQWRVETHVPGWTGDLYGQQVSLHLVARIRDERRFEGVDALRAQIGRDCQTAMELLAADATSCT